jgi:tRNA(Ile)-lysidine synthase
MREAWQSSVASFEDSSTQYPVASTRLPYSVLSRRGGSGYWQLGTEYGFLYHFPVHGLAGRLLKTIRKQELIKAGDRLAVAVSGGADSVALLLLLVELRAELGIVLSVAHVNHQLRGRESDEDAQFVGEIARKHGLETHVHEAPLVPAHSGIEASARKLRYDFFRQLMREGLVSKIATAHTLDDQAETVLLRVLRGAGIRGLSGIHPRLVFEDRGEVVRPLLSFRRTDLENILRERDQTWREDSSNRDLAFLRNRVRHHLLPLLREDFGAAAVENLADLAEIARAEEEHWQSGHPAVRGYERASPAEKEKLAVPSMLTLPVAAQRRLLRNWLAANVDDLAIPFRVIEEVRDLAAGAAGKKLELPGGHWVRRTPRDLCFEKTRSRAEPSSKSYEYRLPVPGQVEVPELGIRLEVVLVDRASVPQNERYELLDSARLPSELVVRNWRSGDRYWPAHTKEAKKIKELLGDRHLTGTQKKLWPVAVGQGGDLVWVHGFATPAEFAPPQDSQRVVWIRVIPN